MRRLTTIPAGWISLTGGYGLACLAGFGVSLVFLLAGCQDAAHAQIPSLGDICYAGGRGEAIQVLSGIALSVIMSVSTALAVIAAARHLQRGRPESLQAVALLFSATMVAAAAILTCIRVAIAYEQLTLTSFLLAAIAGIVCIAVFGPICVGIAVLITRHHTPARGSGDRSA